MFVGVSQWLGAAPRQNVLEKEITISLKDVTLRQALVELEAQTGVKFVYSSSYLRLDERVTIDASSRKLGQLLSELLTPLEIRFAVHESENFVVLTQARTRGLSVPSETESSAPFSYATLVTGRVTDEQNAPMAGVNVVEKGTTNGTSTDADGKFALETRDNPTLLFSFIGFKTQEVEVGSRSVVDIVLEEDRAVLETVMVNAGYWKVSEREQTGSISRVTAKEIQQQPVGNPIAAMIGRMPGVVVTQSSGLPGRGFSVQIRGRNSLRVDGNTPLYIVDGVPYPATAPILPGSVLGNPSPLNAINPSDIESIEILKDADATAIYGTRGANGVVLITTKKGNTGKTHVDFNVYSGFGRVGNFMKLLSREQYMTMRNEAHKNDGSPIFPFEIDLLRWDTTRYTDWQKFLLGGTSNITNAQASISGGTDLTQFQLGVGGYKEGTVSPFNYGEDRMNAHISVSHRSLNKKFTLSTQHSFIVDKNTLPDADLTAFALKLPPIAPAVYNEDGTLNWANGTWFTDINPGVYGIISYTTSTQNLVSNLSLGYELFPGLTLKATGGYNILRSAELRLQPLSAMDPAWGRTSGYSDHMDASTMTWITEPQAEYKTKVAGGNLTALVGSTFQETVREMSSIRADGFTSDELLSNIGSAARIQSLSSSYTQYKYNAFFGRLNYDLHGKYFLNATARRDGSSRFGPGRRFSTFGAVGAAWVFSEDFFANSTVFSYGKIRASTGITGSDQIPDYGYMDTFSSTANPYFGQSGLIPTRLANPDYGWEKTTKNEVALDLGFLRNRLNVTAAYYYNQSSNQLVGYTLPRITGFSSIQMNLPATVRNTGLEISLATQNIKSTNWNWNTSVVITVPRNKLVSYPNIESSSAGNVWEIGKPIFMTKTLHYTGVNPTTGLYDFEDVNGNGIVGDQPGDLKATKMISQNLYGAVTNTITFRGFELSIMVQFADQDGRNFLTTNSFLIPGAYSNQPVEVMNRWRKPGDATSIQKFTISNDGINAYSNAGMSDNAIVNSSFVRLKNISFSYSLPQSVLTRLRASSFKLYVQGQNLYTWTKFVGLDPEPAVPSNLPPLRVLTVGIQASI